MFFFVLFQNYPAIKKWIVSSFLDLQFEWNFVWRKALSDSKMLKKIEFFFFKIFQKFKLSKGKKGLIVYSKGFINSVKLRRQQIFFLILKNCMYSRLNLYGENEWKTEFFVFYEIFSDSVRFFPVWGAISLDIFFIF